LGRAIKHEVKPHGHSNLFVSQTLGRADSRHAVVAV